MSGTEKTPPPGCGRGGRGALLMAALSKVQRRPGVEPSTSEDQTTDASSAPSPTLATPSVSRGISVAQATPAASSLNPRAAMMRLLAAKAGKPAATPTPIQSDSSQAQGAIPKQPTGRAAMLLAGGRGMQLAMRTSSIASSVASSIVSPLPTPAPTPTSVSALGRAISSPMAKISISPSASSPPVQQMQRLEINTLKGQEGLSINLAVNYVRLEVIPGMGFFEYHINFNPQIDSKNMRFKLVNQPSVKALIGEVRIFDGAKLYLPHKLPQPMTDVVSILPTDETPVTVYIKFVAQSMPGDRDSIHLYNLLMRRTMHELNMTLVGRNYFDHRAGIPVPQHKLEVWPGYVTAVQEFQGGLMLNCDASFRVLRNVTARDILVDAFSARKDTFKESFIKQVVGCIVITRYNNKTYRIDDVDWEMTPSSTFPTSDGGETSFVDYYKKSYDVTIQDLKQPMLLHRPKIRAKDAEAAAGADDRSKLVCLVPELCHMTGLTDTMRADFKIMKDIAVHTRVSPEQRQLTLKKYIQNVRNTPGAIKVLKDWGLQLCDNPISLSGRGLPSEKIIMGRNAAFASNREADWGREVVREHVLSAVHLTNWVVIFVNRDAQKAKEFIAMMERVCPAMGMRITPPQSIELTTDRTEFYTRAAKDAISPMVQIIVFIFPTARDDRYNAVKKLCCVEKPIASQVINARTISQPQKLRSVVQKIGLQINCKLGGELWAVPIPLTKTMVCGVDVYHDPTRNCRSVVGFVSSLNNTFTRWFSVAEFQAAGQELTDCLKTALLSALRKFDEVNHFLPEKIVFYRDGVSDGQLQYVRDYETPQMESCFSHFDKAYSPELIVIVVQKRINTRIFLETKGRELANPAPGTVLDHTVTNRNWFDFFLVSQHVRQGTVTPTHYIVVHNTSKLKPDHLQKLSFKLTHLYYNWPGTVRVPAPCQYAHKLAYLCGQNIHKEPSKVLEDKLYFL